MAKVWVHRICPRCTKPVVGGGVLVAVVTVTSANTYACYNNDPDMVRPNFRPKQRSLYHKECFGEALGVEKRSEK